MPRPPREAERQSEIDILVPLYGNQPRSTRNEEIKNYNPLIRAIALQSVRSVHSVVQIPLPNQITTNTLTEDNPVLHQFIVTRRCRSISFIPLPNRKCAGTNHRNVTKLFATNKPTETTCPQSSVCHPNQKAAAAHEPSNKNKGATSQVIAWVCLSW